MKQSHDSYVDYTIIIIIVFPVTASETLSKKTAIFA